MRMFQALKKYYNDFFVDGQFDRDCKLIKRNIDPVYNGEKRIDLIESVYNLILNANSVNELTKLYIKGGNRTYVEIVEEYNRSHSDMKPIVVNSGRGRIIHCQNIIKEAFPTIKYDGDELNFITWLLNDKANMFGEEDDFDKAIEKKELRDKFMQQYNSFKGESSKNIAIRKSDIAIKIPLVEKVEEIDSDDFDNLMEIIRPYSKFVMETVNKTLESMPNEVGYLRFLMSKTSKLTKEDEERKATVLRWLGRYDESLEFDTSKEEEIEDDPSSDNISLSDEEFNISSEYDEDDDLGGVSFNDYVEEQDTDFTANDIFNEMRKNDSIAPSSDNDMDSVFKI
jgi:hypothetical protein